MSAAPTRVLTGAVLTHLRAQVARPVGDAAVPTDQTLPYAVLYPAGSGRLDGPQSDVHADAQQVVQVTSVGESREQAEALSDRVRAAMLDARPAVAGRYVQDVQLDASQPVRRDDDVRPALWYAVDLFRLWTTPA